MNWRQWSFLGVQNDQMTDIPLDVPIKGFPVVVSATQRASGTEEQNVLIGQSVIYLNV